MEQRYIVALEIGSSKIRCAVGTLDFNGALTVLAVEEEPQMNEYVRYGCIQNVEGVSAHVNSIIKKIENRSGISPRKVKGVYVALGGRSLSASKVDIERAYAEETEITEAIVSQIKAEALRSSYSDRDAVEVLVRDFIINNQENATPVGTIARNISASLNVVSCRPQLRRNIERAISERLQLKINDYIVRPTAIADLVLSKDEKRLGCMLVDFGAETTTVSIYKGGTLRYLATLPLGSRNITRDIATGLNKLEERAEELKRAVGDAVPSVDGYKNPDGIDTTEVNAYVQARAGEIVSNVLEQMNYAGIRDLPGGIIVVGGGAKLKGINHLLETQSKLPLRIGTPTSAVRIADAKIQGADAVDVIALLDAASRRTPMMCMEAPASIFPPAPEGSTNCPDDDDDDDFDDEEEDDFIPRKGGKGKGKDDEKKGPGWLDRLRRSAERLFTEDDEDDEDDE